MRRLRWLAVGAILLAPTGCGLVLDLGSAEDAGSRPDRAALSDAGEGGAEGGAEGGPAADATVLDAAPRGDGGDGGDGGGECDGGCPICIEVEVRLTETAGDEEWATITRVGGGLSVAWWVPTENDTYGRFIALDGSPLGGTVAVGPPARTPSLASSPTVPALAVGGNPGRLFTHGPAGFTRTFELGDGRARQPHVRPDGDGWVLVWNQGHTDGSQSLGFLTVDSMGVDRTPPRAVAAGALDLSEPRVAVLGSRYFVAWDEEADPRPNSRYATFTADDPPPPATVLGLGSDDAAVAAGADAFAAVWIEKSDGQALAFQLFDARDGAPLGTPRYLLGRVAHRDEPAIAWNGTSWAVVVEEGTATEVDEVIYMVMVGADGSVRAQRQVSHGGGYAIEAAVTWSGVGWSVAWEDTRDGNSEIYYAHVCP